MPMPSSGAISFSQLQTEFGGANPISLSEYYNGAGLVSNGAVPSSGQISLSQFYGLSAFSPTTVTRTSGTALTETVPAGATSVRIRVGGGGGAGGLRSGLVGGGGGEGGWCEKTIAVVGGNTFTYTVAQVRLGRSGSVGSGNAGFASTVSGTVSGGSVSMTANGGGGGAQISGGAGGTATGGDTNTTGDSGDISGSGGAGGNGNSTQSGAGGNGEEFIDVFSTSGMGERGEIEFYYT